MLAKAFMKWTNLYPVFLKETRSSEEVPPQSQPPPPSPVMGRATETQQSATSLAGAGDRSQGEWSWWGIQEERSSATCREWQVLWETADTRNPPEWQTWDPTAYIYWPGQIYYHKGGCGEWISRYWHRCQSTAGSEQTLQCCLGIPIANGIDTRDWRSFKNMTPNSFPKKHLYALSNSRFHYKEGVKGTFIVYQMKEGPFSVT